MGRGVRLACLLVGLLAFLLLDIASAKIAGTMCPMSNGVVLVWNSRDLRRAVNDPNCAIVYLDRGTYILEETLRISRCMTLRALHSDAYTNPANIPIIQSNGEVDILIQLNGARCKEEVQGMIKDLYLTGAKKWAILVGNSANFEITNNHIKRNIEQGIIVVTSQDITISNNAITDNEEQGITIINSSLTDASTGNRLANGEDCGSYREALGWPQGFRSPEIKISRDFLTDFPTIQEAIDAACPGDEILLAPGDYQEELSAEGNLWIQDKNLKLKSETTAEEVRLIARDPNKPVIKITGDSTSPEVTLEGLVIEGSSEPAGIAIEGRTAKVKVTILNTRVGSVRENEGFQEGISVIGNADVILGNPEGQGVQISGSISSGLHLEGTECGQPEVIINKAYINFNKGSGIVADQDSNGNINIKYYVDIQGNGENGISLYGGSTLTAHDAMVIIDQNYGHGIALFDKASAELTGGGSTVEINANQDSGIAVTDNTTLQIAGGSDVEQSCQRPPEEGIVLQGNAEYGIWASGSATLEIHSASIWGHKVGIYATNFAQVTIQGSGICEANETGILLDAGVPAGEQGFAAELVENVVKGNGEYGIAEFIRTCFPYQLNSPWSFNGKVSGCGNEIADNGEKNFCPFRGERSLQFLVQPCSEERG